MTDQPHQSQFAVEARAVAALGAARSNWLDAFADLELGISKCLARHCGGKNKNNLSQRLDHLAALQSSADLSCLDQGRLGGIVSHCRRLALLRGTLVHSHMRVCIIDHVAIALFSNVAGEGTKSPRHVAMTLEQIERSTQNLRALAADLGTFA